MFRTYNAMIGDKFHNNHKVMKDFRFQVSRFGNETGLCSNIM